jgi:hypothetical protein
MLQATQQLVQGHLIGAIDSSSQNIGHVFLGVRMGDTVEQFRLHTGEIYDLSDGWKIRLISVLEPTSDRGKNLIKLELLNPDSDKTL